MNRVTLIGRLTRNPETRVSAGDNATSICKFILAIDRRTKGETDFINIVAFGKTGEVCQKYLAKGRQTAVEGRIQTRSYENKDGKKVNVFEIVADNVEFLGSKQDAQQAPTQQQQFIDDTETDEDLPWNV